MVKERRERGPGGEDKGGAPSESLESRESTACPPSRRLLDGEADVHVMAATGRAALLARDVGEDPPHLLSELLLREWSNALRVAPSCILRVERAALDCRRVGRDARLGQELTGWV